MNTIDKTFQLTRNPQQLDYMKKLDLIDSNLNYFKDNDSKKMDLEELEMLRTLANDER
jgi:hypothetical protein